MEVIKKYKSQFLFHFILNLACVVFITYASFAHYPLGTAIKGHVFYLIHFIGLQLTVFGILYFLSIYRWVFAIVFPPLFVFFSTVAYWVYFQDIAITFSIFQVAAETKPDIILELISIPFALYFTLAIAVSILLVKWRQKLQLNHWKSPLLAVAIIGLISYELVENYKYGAFNRRLPYNVIVAANEYFDKNTLALKKITQPLQIKNDSLTIIFILGETVRADHMQLNGYKRENNPLLSKRKRLISFANAYTPKTYTAESLPQILTDATFSDDYSQPKFSIIDILNHAGVQTGWLGNQTPEKSYEQFIKQSTFSEIIDPMHSEQSFQKAYDEELIPMLIKNYKPFQKQFVTMHMMGSHWWYETRYPAAFRKFKPVITSKHITSNTKEEMINSYDNTILYLDYFIDKTITELEKYKSEILLIYLSDHGELLGENNQWLHAQAGKAVENPAMLIWYSESFEKKHPETCAKLNAIKKNKTDLDFFFPTVIDLFGIQGVPYPKEKSLLK